MTGFLHSIDATNHEPRHAALEAPGLTPLELLKARRLERELRRADTAHSKAVQRLGRLGPDWKIVDWRRLNTAEVDPGARMNFLAIGPGGIFSVTIKRHGRSRVMMAGDVVQIDGKRPKHVEEVRRNAARAAQALSRSARTPVPVVPVLAFEGSGVISVHGLPKGCVVTTYGELAHVLAAHGERILPGTVDKLHEIASDPRTWLNPPYRPVSPNEYRWYGPETPADKKATRR